MGGGGSYYDRDINRTSGTSSRQAEERLSQRGVNAAMNPKDRKIVSDSASPVVIVFDITGSMGQFPKVIFDKMPMIAGQLQISGYLQDPAICLAAVGDVICDRGPIQIGEFCAPRELDQWLTRIWLEGGGGGNGGESYEFMAYYFARRCELKSATEPFCIFIGDEALRESLPGRELRAYFGGECEGTRADAVFKELLAKFGGNVFLVHKKYTQGGDDAIVAQWQRMLGEERVLLMGSDEKAIGDIVLGIIAVRTGRCTVEEYAEEMRTRVDVNTGELDPQSEGRVAQVIKALQPLAALPSMVSRGRRGKKAAAKAEAAKPARAARAPKAEPKPAPDEAKPKKRRGRI